MVDIIQMKTTIVVGVNHGVKEMHVLTANLVPTHTVLIVFKKVKHSGG